MEKETLKFILDEQVDSISNPELKELTYRIIEKLPEGFWARESSKKYHPVDERGECGNLIHSLKVEKLALRLLEPTHTNKEEIDLIKSASLLHDCMRHGPEGTAPFSVGNHPQLVREFIACKGLTCELSDKVCDLIETHMGPWGHPPFFPELSLNSVLQLADYLAAQTDISVEL